jgi:hypothetical protein
VRQAARAAARDGNDGTHDNADQREREHRDDQPSGTPCCIRTGRWELRRQPVENELEDLLGLRKILEPVEAEVAKRRLPIVGEKGTRGRGQ